MLSKVLGFLEKAPSIFGEPVLATAFGLRFAQVQQLILQILTCVHLSSVQILLNYLPLEKALWSSLLKKQR